MASPSTHCNSTLGTSEPYWEALSMLLHAYPPQENAWQAYVQVADAHSRDDSFHICNFTISRSTCQKEICRNFANKTKHLFQEGPRKEALVWKKPSASSLLWLQQTQLSKETFGFSKGLVDFSPADSAAETISFPFLSFHSIYDFFSNKTRKKRCKPNFSGCQALQKETECPTHSSPHQ